MFRTLSVSAVKAATSRKVIARRDIIRTYARLCSERDDAIDAALYDSSKVTIDTRDAACCAVFSFLVRAIPTMAGTDWARSNLPYELYLAQLWLRKADDAISNPVIRKDVKMACLAISRLCSDYDIRPEDI
jgi:hypothetical protein